MRLMLRRLVGLWLFVLLVGCASVQPQADVAPLSAEAKAFAGMTAYLASDELAGRAPGTPGINQARDWIVAQFREAGLQPGFDPSYTQTLPVAVRMDVGERRLTFGSQGDEHRVDDPRPMGFGASGSFAGPAVFVGYSITAPEHDHDDYAKATDLRGKVAVMYRYEPLDENHRSRWHAGRGWTAHATLSRKAALAAEHGAAAVVIVNPPSRAAAPRPRTEAAMHFEPIDVPVMMIGFDQFKRMLREAGHGNAMAAARQLQRRADAGAAAEPLGLRIRGKVKLNITRKPSANIAATLPGTGALPGVVVVGAHYDHLGMGGWGSRVSDEAVHHGADDNASGVAALVMVARRMGSVRRERAKPQAARSVVFAAFTGEERGLVGSQYFVKHLDDAGLDADDIVAMVNLDMVGRLRSDRLHVFGVNTGERWLELIERAGEGTGLDVRARGSGLGASDHASFYRAGVPVVHVFTGLHSDYHTPADTADKLNPRGAVRVVDFVERLVEVLRHDRRRVGYRPPARR